MPAAITFAFDPVLRLSDTATVRLETIGLAVVLFIGLLLAARIGSVTPATGPFPAPPVVPAVPGLRVDDLVFIAVGAVPGAIFGGRLGYVLDNLDFYRANPNAILDPAQGGLSLSLAVPLGILTAGIIARLLDAHVGRWLHAAALPLLFVLGAGKLVGVLGASGQGAPSDVSWATSYAGPGPWGVLAADLPSHPSQVYEAILVGVALLATALILRYGVAARRDGAAMFFALGFWAIARFASAFTWRDPLAAGPLRTEQLLLMAVFVIAIVGVLERIRAPLPGLAELPLVVPMTNDLPPQAASSSDEPAAIPPLVESEITGAELPDTAAADVVSSDEALRELAVPELAVPELAVPDPEAPKPPEGDEMPLAPGPAATTPPRIRRRRRVSTDDEPAATPLAVEPPTDAEIRPD